MPNSILTKIETRLNSTPLYSYDTLSMNETLRNFSHSPDVTKNNLSYYASASFPPGPPRLVPPLKRPRLMVAPARPVIKTAAPQKPQAPAPPPINQLKIYSNPDILICGNCREMFTELQELLDHKKTYCKLRFTCKCHSLNGVKTRMPGEDLASAMLLCVVCKDSFQSAWDLMVHVQAAHMMNIYELGVPKTDNGIKSSPPSSPLASPDPRSSNDKDKESREDTPTLDDDDDVVELSCDDILASPDMKSEDIQLDKEIDDLLGVQQTAQACIMRALSIEQPSMNNQNSMSFKSEKSAVSVPITNGELSAQE